MSGMTGAICSCGWKLKVRRGRIWACVVTILFHLHARRCTEVES